MNLIGIGNSGPDITSTNYWDSEHAHHGLCYLSANAGTWRLLVPPEAETLLVEMRTGKRATVEPSLHAPGRCWDVVFEDGTDSPFSVAIDRQQLDQALAKGECKLAVWTRRGKELDLPCEINI